MNAIELKDQVNVFGKVRISDTRLFVCHRQWAFGWSAKNETFCDVEENVINWLQLWIMIWGWTVFYVCKNWVKRLQKNNFAKMAGIFFIWANTIKVLMANERGDRQLCKLSHNMILDHVKFWRYSLLNF